MTMFNKTLFHVLMACAALFLMTITGCEDDDGMENPCEGIICDTGEICVDGTCIEQGGEGTVLVTENITSNTTWTNDKIWILGGRIAVESGAELCIEPGTVIKGQVGQESNASVLIIARGGQICAEGTADEPIIFTSIADEITPEMVAAGNLASPNLTPDTRNLWGGLIILGRARISASADAVQIEGIPTSDPNGLYGGSDDDDNSGTLRYVSIRHGGTLIGEGNEINGLTLGGVGRGTTIDHIEVVANLDDGIEWFGGAVSVSDVVVWNTGDDAIDTDQAWSGTLNNFAVITPEGHCFELDGPEGSLEAGHEITNGFINAQGAARLIDVDPNSIVDFDRLFFTGISEGQDIGCAGCAENSENAVGVTGGNIELNIPSGSLNDYVSEWIGVDVRTATTASVGPDKSRLMGWTWTGSAGMLD